MVSAFSIPAIGDSPGNYPVVTSMDGPSVITPDGGPYTFSVSVANGASPYTYTWYYAKYQEDTGLTTSTILYQGQEYNSVSFSFSQIKPPNTEAGGYVEVEVTDSQGRQAMWASNDSYYGEEHSWSFTFNYAPSPTSGDGFVLSKSPANWPYTPYIPPQSADVSLSSSDSSSSSDLFPSWIPLAIGAGVVAIVAIVGAIGVIGVIVVRKGRSAKGQSYGTTPTGNSSSTDSSTNDRSDDPDDDNDKKGAGILRLTYPCGRSPKVFTRGWLFGAECIDEHGNDVSDLVEWSGTGSFEPGSGRRSRPVFDHEGPNEITISCKSGETTLKQTIPIVVVSPDNYARVGSKAFCPADVHSTGGGSSDTGSGCAGCPHEVFGPVTAGSPTVFIDGLPAARVGDPGVHATCCGPNTFTIAEGDKEVLIDGRPAARIGDRTQHCGGTGKIISKS